MRVKGFSLIEVLVVVAVLGVLMLVAYPNIQNSLEVRNLENQARSILGTLQQAKFQAVRTKLNHRVRFDNSQGYWMYFVEQQVSAGVWQAVRNTGRKSVPDKFSTTVNLPNNAVEFTPLGMPDRLTYSTTQNNVTLQSPNLVKQGKPSRRIVNIFAGGSIQYLKAT